MLFSFSFFSFVALFYSCDFVSSVTRIIFGFVPITRFRIGSNFLDFGQLTVTNNCPVECESKVIRLFHHSESETEFIAHQYGM
jgi:hypothetical protein